MTGRGAGCCCNGAWKGTLADEGEVEKTEVRSDRTEVDSSSANDVRRRIDFGGGPLTETDDATDDDEELARDESELVDALRSGGLGRESWLLLTLDGTAAGIARGEAAMTRSVGFEADDSALCC
jgi:hypothetical protein